MSTKAGNFQEKMTDKSYYFWKADDDCYYLSYYAEIEQQNKVPCHRGLVTNTRIKRNRNKATTKKIH